VLIATAYNEAIATANIARQHSRSTM